MNKNLVTWIKIAVGVMIGVAVIALLTKGFSTNPFALTKTVTETSNTASALLRGSI